MEYFDLYDQNANPLGQKKLRPKVHRDGDWHKSVDIWLLNPRTAEVLLQKRAAEKESYPNLWEISCSGHISAGEGSLISAVREVEEELGLSISESDLEYLFSDKEQHITNQGTFINREFKDVYLLEGNYPLDAITILEEEVAEVKYIQIPEFEKWLSQNPDDFVPHENIYRRSLDFFKKRLSR